MPNRNHTLNFLIKLLNLSPSLGDTEIKLLMNFLKDNKVLPILDLTNYPMSNDGINDIAEMLRADDFISVVKLQSQTISKEGLNSLTEALKHNKSLKKVRFRFQNLYKSGSNCWDNFAEMLEKNTSLEKLSLCYTPLLEYDGLSLIIALLNNTSLQKLNLAGSVFSEMIAAAIAYMLSKNKTLKSLNLHSSALGDVGIGVIASALKNNTNLQSLNLRWTGCKQKGAEALADMLKVNTTLRSIDMSELERSPGRQVYIIPGLNDFIKALAVNYSLLEFKRPYANTPEEEKDYALIQSYLDRNKKIDEIFSCFSESTLNVDIDNLLQKMQEFEKIVDNEREVALPEDSYLIEGYRLLKALKVMYVNRINTPSLQKIYEDEVFGWLSKPFKHAAFQKKANTVLAELLYYGVSFQGLNSKQQRNRYQMLLYCLRDNYLDNEFTTQFTTYSILRLKNKGDEPKMSWPSLTQPISYEIALNLVKKILNETESFKDENEKNGLLQFSEQSVYYLESYQYLSRSSLFIDELKREYPGKTEFPLIEDFIYKSSTKEIPILNINYPTPYPSTLPAPQPGNLETKYSKIRTRVMHCFKNETKGEEIYSLFKDLFIRPDHVFHTTNSTGIKTIQALLKQETLSPLAILKNIQKIAAEKTKQGFYNWYSHLSIFGKGRHKNIDMLYLELARLPIEGTQSLDNRYLCSKLTDIIATIDTVSQSESFCF
ncbi:MAG: hypothetical protein LCH30_08595 [Proteobacteria bacterium]|nr:hypothetical protein [Pseudomonadota bacterium]